MKHSDEKNGVFDTWFTTFHGTGSKAAEKTKKTVTGILSGSLLAPGACLL